MKRGNSKKADKKIKIAAILILALILATTIAITITKLNEKGRITGIDAPEKSRQITGFVLYSGLAELQLSKAILMAATLVFAVTIIGVFIIKTREIRRLQMLKPKHRRKRK